MFFVDELGLWAQQTIIGVPSGKPIAKAANRRYAANADWIYVLSKGLPRYVHVIRDQPNKSAGKVKNSRTICNPDDTERIACGGDYVIAQIGHRTNVWTYTVGGRSTATDRVSRGHKAKMPERLAEDLIISFSKPNDLVFDPMAGAGTTLKMAMLNNRKFLGMELNDEYVEIIQRRLEHAEKKDRPKRLDAFLNGFAS